MSKPTKENIASVMSGLESFLAHVIKNKAFDLKEFVSFMEPKFKAEGYREKLDYKVGNSSGGNILILTEIAAGDFIAASGAIREIRRVYPGARITLVVNPRTFDLAKNCPYVDEIILNPQKVTSFYPLPVFYKMDMTIAQRILENRFDICFAFALHPYMPLLMYMSGAKIRVTATDYNDLAEFKAGKGLTDQLMRLATHLFPYSAYGTHTADRFFSLLENFLHLPITNRRLEVWYTPADVGIVKGYLHKNSAPVYSLNMGSVYPKNHYPPEKYAKLLKLILQEEPTATFVILGSGATDLQSAAIIKEVAPQLYEKNIIDFTDKLSYMQSAAVLNFCKIHIGNDTGTVHVAAAVGCPVLTLMCFAADLPISNRDNPQRWYPYGVPSVVIQPKHALPECKNISPHDFRGCAANSPHCITQIEPKTLFKGFKLLKERIAKKINEPLYIS